MAKPRKRVVSVLGGSLEMTVNVAGKGKPLLFLHSAGGFYWDDFLDELSEHYKVYAPHFPGTAPGRPNDIEKIDNLWDTVIASNKKMYFDGAFFRWTLGKRTCGTATKGDSETYIDCPDWSLDGKSSLLSLELVLPKLRRDHGCTFL